MKPRNQRPDQALSAVKGRNLKKPDRYTDDNGLHLVVNSSGARRRVLRRVVRGRHRDTGLGSVKLVSLADAREKAASDRRVAHNGGDPLAQRRAKQARPTFREAAERVHAGHGKGWRCSFTGSGSFPNWSQNDHQDILD
ncbi:MAG: DUF4102 domain-containing protein [Rhodospirillales bacterium]|nr:DUF4102 domain-containing protein [Rhodospirillales bacterium]